MAKLIFQDGVPDEYGVKADLINNPDGTISFRDRTNWITTPTPHNAENMNKLAQYEDITNTITLLTPFTNPGFFKVLKIENLIFIQYMKDNISPSISLSAGGSIDFATGIPNFGFGVYEKELDLGRTNGFVSTYARGGVRIFIGGASVKKLLLSNNTESTASTNRVVFSVSYIIS